MGGHSSLKAEDSQSGDRGLRTEEERDEKGKKSDLPTTQPPQTALRLTESLEQLQSKQDERWCLLLRTIQEKSAADLEQLRITIKINQIDPQEILARHAIAAEEAKEQDLRYQAEREKEKQEDIEDQEKAEARRRLRSKH